MRDDLHIIDVIERLRSWLFAERPQLDEICRRRVENFAADHPIRFYKERFLLGLAQGDVASPSHMREVARFNRRAEEAPLELRREIIAEDPPPFYARMGRAKRGAMLDCLARFDGFGADPYDAGRVFGQSLREGERLEAARNFVKERFPSLKGLDIYRVLKAWDYPLILPSLRRQQFFFRIGALVSRSNTVEGMTRMTELGDAIHHLTGEALQTVDLVSGVFCGDEPGYPQELSRCGARPHCETCPISANCDYYKFNRQPKTEKHATIKDWDVSQRPRERFARHGPGQLSDAELLAILLRTGTAKSTAMEMAHHLLRRFDGLRGFDEATLAELCHEKGVGPVKAVTLKAAIELGKRVLRESGKIGDGVKSAYDIFHLYRHRFANVKVEQFHLVCLNTKHEAIHEEMVSQGSLASSVVHPRESFKDAIRQSAAAVIFVHNHPSGDASPSDLDRQVTQRLREAGQILGIPVLDHVIIGENAYFSFQEDRLFDMTEEERE